MSTFRKHLCATAFGLAIAAAIPLGANAAPLPFTVDPDGFGIAGGPYASFVATDINGTSDALIRQIAATTQFEQGWIQFQSFTNNGVGVSNSTSRLIPTGDSGAGATTYNLFAFFSAFVNGITGFAPGQIGTIGAGDFNYVVFANPGSTDTFLPGSTSNAGGTAPTVTLVGTNFVVAQGSSLFGSAGFQLATGAPIFAATSSFIICNGTSGQGLQGSTTVAAPACGTFDARSYFTAPNPFYQFDLTSTTSGSANNLSVFGGVLLPGAPPNATLNGIVADVNFAVPEPSTLALLGATLLLAGLRMRSRGKTQL